jgi:hypothetical protein
MESNRDQYGGIKMVTLNPVTRKKVENLIAAVKVSEKIDEHGGWDFGSEFDYKGRGSALNWDLYAYGSDSHSKRFMIVIQVRQFIRRKKNYFPGIRKSYFLIGRNEDNSVFAHCVESRIIHNAIKKKQDVLLAVQSWIFNCDYKKVERQGDIGFIKVKRIKGLQVDKTEIVIRASHQIESENILRDSKNFYVLNPQVTHLMNVHPALSLIGWYKVAIGQRCSNWDFASPTID